MESTILKKNIMIRDVELLINYKEMPAYKGAEQKQYKILKENPFVQITDNKTYAIAKERRTLLRKGRYELQQGEKLIAKKMKDFRKFVKDETKNLISITQEAENKQQAEVERYEHQKKREREELARKEQERKQAILNKIEQFTTEKNTSIATATLNTIDAIIKDIENSKLEVEEFVPELKSVKNILLDRAHIKQNQLIENEKLRVEREQADLERQKLEAERKKLEAERKKAEAEQKRQADLERKKLEAERKKLEAERKKVEAEQKRQADLERKKLEAERKKLEAEQKELERKKAENHKAELQKKESERIAILQNMGLQYHDSKIIYCKKELKAIDLKNLSNIDFEQLKENLKTSIDNINKEIGLQKVELKKLQDILTNFDTTSFERKVFESKELSAIFNKFINQIKTAKKEALDSIKVSPK